MKSSENNGSMKPETNFILAGSITSKTTDQLYNLQTSRTRGSPCLIGSTTEVKPVEFFRIWLEIIEAKNLPLIAPLKAKQLSKRSTAHKGRYKRSSPSQEPSAYVTFQAAVENENTIKSHEGMVCSTNVAQINSNPVWKNTFNISISADYLTNNRRFILKVWRKTPSSPSSRSLPTPLDDSVIGVTTLNLNTLFTNANTMNDWFNIVDFNGHINGQLHVAARPVDGLKQCFNIFPHQCDNHLDELLNSFESNLNINTDLSNVIKSKFTELEEISQRLRARLLKVTANPVVDLSETSDANLDEFERDLNTKVCEDEEENLKFFSSLESSNNDRAQSNEQIQ